MSYSYIEVMSHVAKLKEIQRSRHNHKSIFITVILNSMVQLLNDADTADLYMQKICTNTSITVLCDWLYLDTK